MKIVGVEMFHVKHLFFGVFNFSEKSELLLE